jgi:hypothetical protein
MFRSGWALAGVAAVFTAAQGAAAAIEGGTSLEIVEAAALPTEMLPRAADLTLRYVQEDGPESGHVRVLLTPALQPLTMLEARVAAQDAFLKALDEPGLGDKLSRITVVVRLVPASHPNPDGAEQVITFLHKGGRDWSVLPGD